MTACGFRGWLLPSRCFASVYCCHFSFLFNFGCILMSTCCTSFSHFVSKIQTTTTYQHIPHHTITHSTHSTLLFCCVLQDSRLIADRFYWRRIFQVSYHSRRWRTTDVNHNVLIESLVPNCNFDNSVVDALWI